MSYFYGLLILLFSFAANAFPLSGVKEYGFSNNWFPTGQGACDYVKELQGASGIGHSYVYTGSVCVRTTSGGATTNYNILVRNAASCPANSSISGSQCICASGYVESGNSCIPEPDRDPCELLSGACEAYGGKRQSWVKPGRSAGAWTCRRATAIGGFDMFPGCQMGCLGENVGMDTSMQDDSGNWFASGQAKMTGGTCDPAVIENLNKSEDPDYDQNLEPEPSNEPDPTCPNGFKGSVNGVSVCLPPKASSGITEMEEKDNGDGTKTNTKTQVKCENGKCEVTKTSTTTNTQTNTTVSSSSTTTTVDKAAYCANNSTAGVCKNEQGEEEGNGKFGGSCDAGFTCEGDAVQCAIAKEQHRRMCQLFDDKAPQLQLYDREKGKEGVQRGEEGEVIDLPGRISTDSLIGAGSCMADIQVQFMDRPLTVKLSSLCPYLEMLGNILVAVGMVMAIRIVGVR